MEDWSKILYYDETSPSCLRWKIKPAKNVDIGDVAGCLKSVGYYKVGYNRKSYSCHRIVWELFYGEIDQCFQVDHINGASTDNSISNLRLVNIRQNSQNRKMLTTNTSGATGVSLKSNGTQWRADWSNLDGKQESKVFSINKYGYELAFNLACEYRTKMIQEMNARGSDYTDRHGT